MKYEKSCGAIVYLKQDSSIKLLLLKHKCGGHWSFPKGHVEKGETETQTALREVKEETGISIDLKEGFRQSVEYYPKPNVKKQVVYFIGETKTSEYKMQEEEIGEITWANIENAYNMVTFKNDKKLIYKANEFLLQKKELIKNSLWFC